MLTPLALGALAILALLVSIVAATSAWRLVRGVPLLARLSPPTPHRWPKVSVIVPACNEEATLEKAMRSRLGEQYPNAEYIVVDDRSTDRTGEIVDRLAAEDDRIVPLHLTELPTDWLGKVHAMQRALEVATGDYVLFSDADIHHEPGTLCRVVAQCEAARIDHVAIFPDVWSGTFWLDVMMNTFLRFICLASRAWKVADPKSRISIGGGVFNLVRRTALERAGGLAPLKLEVVDDAALGQMIKWSGGRQAVFNGRGFVGLYFYSSLSEAIRGMEKNAFAVVRFNVARFIVFLVVLLAMELGPFALLAASGGVPRVIAAVAVALGLASQLAVLRWLRRPLLPAFLAPIGACIMVAGALRSMVYTLARGGIEWRGTRYPLAALRAGMRLVLA